MRERSNGRRILPAVSLRTRLLLAAVMWTAVGVLLPVEGIVWSVGGYGPLGLALAAPFLGVGLLKAKMLDRFCGEIVEHNRRLGPDGSILGSLPLRTWIMVAVMIGMGSVLRHFLAGGHPRAWLGLVYVAVGSALLISSRRLWSGWRGQGD